MGLISLPEKLLAFNIFVKAKEETFRQVSEETVKDKIEYVYIDLLVYKFPYLSQKKTSVNFLKDRLTASGIFFLLRCNLVGFLSSIFTLF